MKQKYEVIKKEAQELKSTIGCFAPIVEDFFDRKFPHDDKNMLERLQTLERLVPHADILYAEISKKLYSGEYSLKKLSKIEEMPMVLSYGHHNMIIKGWHAIANMYKLLYNAEETRGYEVRMELKELKRKMNQPTNIVDGEKVDSKEMSADSITDRDYFEVIISKYVSKITEIERKGKLDYDIKFFNGIIASTPLDYVTDRGVSEGVIFDKWVYIRSDHLERIFGLSFNGVKPLDVIHKMAEDRNIRTFINDDKLTRRIGYVSRMVGPEEFYAIPLASIKNHIIKYRITK